MICLFDCYGNLLTDKQRTLFNYYFNEDLSLAEISDMMGVSRQAVHNSVARCEEALKSYEKNLGVLARSEETDALLDDVITAIEKSLDSNDWSEKTYGELLDRLRQFRKAE